MSVSLYANLMFVVVELVMAIVTGSQAVLLDGVYDGIEFVMLLPSIFLIPLLYKPSNEKYPFGHMQMETVFIVVKGITMITVTVGLITNSINILFHGGRTVDFGVVAWFELLACVLGIIVTFYLKRKNKAMNSPLITVEMQGWKMDSMLSLGMTAVFFLPVFLPFKGVGQLTPYLDPFITIVLSMIMIPLVGDVKELKYVKKFVVETADAEIAAANSSLKYEVGTMIEIPRAALTADEIAKEADFFCFGTNDLTQMAFGFSRDDAGKFLDAYYDAKIFENDPFAKLDQTGVGKLMDMAITLGKPVNPNLHVGICGEHGGDPSSVEFCNKLGLDYVSCSPFRVPIARLAAAQAAIANK